MPIPESVAHYLKQARQMSPEELVEALSHLVKTDNLQELPTSTTDALKLQLDADDANADLFYSRVLPADEIDIHLFTAAEADHALRTYINNLFQELARENDVERNDKVLHALIVNLQEKVTQEASQQSFQDFC